MASFAGYEHSYAKGRLDAGESPQQAALRELTEETGLVGRMVGLVGDFAGQTGVTRFYVGIRNGGTEAPSDETWAVKTVTPLVALALLNVQRDKEVLYRLVELAASLTPPGRGRSPGCPCAAACRPAGSSVPLTTEAAPYPVGTSGNRWPRAGRCRTRSFGPREN